MRGEGAGAGEAGAAGHRTLHFLAGPVLVVGVLLQHGCASFSQYLEKAPSRAFSLMEAPTTAFILKTLC